MGVISRARRLRAREQAQALTCAGPLVLAAIGLRLMPVSRLLRIAARPVGGSPASDVDIRALAVAVDRVARYLPGATCLAQSVALTWMLRGRGAPAEIRLGARSGSGLDAHAWVECDGVPVTDPRGAAALIGGRRLETKG